MELNVLIKLVVKKLLQPIGSPLRESILELVLFLFFFKESLDRFLGDLLILLRHLVEDHGIKHEQVLNCQLHDAFDNLIALFVSDQSLLNLPFPLASKNNIVPFHALLVLVGYFVPDDIVEIIDVVLKPVYENRVTVLQNESQNV